MTEPFSTLPLAAETLSNLEDLGFEAMTPIQAQALPHLLQGQDLIGQARTGSGKTVAFGLGLLQRLDVEQFRVQSLVLCPTRELAKQVANALRQLARTTHNTKVLSLCGGESAGPQFGSLEHGAHVIVGTPGRVLFHLRKGSLSLRHLNTLILDEADRMLDMGFYDDIDEIVSYCPAERQTLLFSATYPEDIQALSAAYMKEPVIVQVDEEHRHEDIAQQLFVVENNAAKGALVKQLLQAYQPTSCLLFCNTKAAVDALTEALEEASFPALAIHGDLEQRERTEVLVRFANGSCPLLVATDVAARGLDIESLAMVMNVDLPFDPEVYVHRIGRTGRAGADGLAVSLVVDSGADAERRSRIEALLGEAIPEGEPPSWEPTATPLEAEMVTLQLDGGKKRKLRPGDILGALTKDAGLPGHKIGKIDIFPHTAYVAVHRSIAHEAFKQFKFGKVKGRQFRVRRR